MKDYLSYDRLERLRKEVEMYKKHEPTSVL